MMGGGVRQRPFHGVFTVSLLQYLVGRSPLSEPSAPHQSNATNNCPSLEGEGEVRPGYTVWCVNVPALHSGAQYAVLLRGSDIQ